MGASLHNSVRTYTRKTTACNSRLCGPCLPHMRTSAGHTSTNKRSQPPAPWLLSTLTMIFCGGTHSTRRYWMLMRPLDIGEILL